MFLADTVAPTTAAPDESVTIPDRVARTSWAFAESAAKSKNKATVGILTLSSFPMV